MRIANLALSILMLSLFGLSSNLVLVNIAHAIVCYTDADTDDFGDSATEQEFPELQQCPDGMVSNAEDCNDRDASVNPGAAELVGDGVDQNCDNVDECYVDRDNDSFGGQSTTPGSSLSCTSEPLLSDNNQDCNDANANMFPGNPEICDGLDNDCNEVADDGGVCDLDSDNDSIPDVAEFDGDTDDDGTPDYLDPDDDNDNVPTIDEDPDGDGDPLTDDTDNDEMPNYRDPDDDDDGYLTFAEDSNDDGDPTNDDVDADTVPDYLDLDSDDDGVLDFFELETNSDAGCDGSVCQSDDLPNRIDTDDDGDGIPTIEEDWNRDGDPTNDDFDGDFLPDYLDTDPIPEEVFLDGFEDFLVTFAIEFCRLQFPLVLNTIPGEQTTVYARLYIDGLTTASGANDPEPLVIGYIGYGPDGSDPAFGWTWTEGIPNVDYGAGSPEYESNNDEYQAVLTAPGAGEYDYAFRFSGDGGQTFTYCDGMSEGSSDGYQPSNAGQLTVVSP